ncbi:MAG TPA: serine hydrolase domain-containing protein [Gemmatimonadaceae bacterium]|nr:serine hydrolase domain-containing protein [Gemmatimonadaceae bacterium]
MKSALLLLVSLPTLALGQGDLTATADRIFAQWTKDTPGCAAGVAQNGRTLLTRGWGMANLETGTPITGETIFESGSVAKQFTATAILLLMSDGKLRLDDRVQEHLPELPEYGRPLTIRHLLSHTSGLREWSNLVAVDGWPRGTRAHTQEDFLEVVFAQRELNYPVGDHYSYTNSGFGLLVTIIERVSGMPFTQFTGERIFKPLGMTKTSWREDFERIVPGRAQAYARRGNAWALDMPFDNVVGAGGMLTTVGDWLKWNDALDKRTLGGWWVDSLESRATLTSGRKITYAMGVVVANWRGEREVAHSGSTGGYATYLLRLPARGVSVAVMCNSAGSNPTTFARQLAEALVPGLPATIAADTVAVDAAALARVAGVYRSTRTYEPLFVGVAGPGGGRGGANVRGLRGGGMMIGNTRTEFVAGPDGRPSGLRQFPASGDTVDFRYAGASVWAPNVTDLAAFTGQYTSGEVRTTWTARVEGRRLQVSSRRGNRILLTPVYPDAFTSPGLGTVWFSRDSRGQVDAMHVSAGRLWNMTIPRLPSGTK